MKPTAILVNVARGAIIEEAALVDVLRDQRIAGAALDVFETEPLPQGHALRELPNVILTPHAIGHTVEAAHATRNQAVENVMGLLAGVLPASCKNPEVEQAWRRRIHIYE